tara:strand:- start:11608 stop:12165 length:558 start_codon:yes stop_codon:yes gene_type:complete
MKNKFDNIQKLVFFIICFGVLCRLLPLPHNFQPVIALTVFGGIYIKNSNIAFILPISIILISDIILGYIPSIGGTYIPLIIVYIFTLMINELNFYKKLSHLFILPHLFISALIFYLTSNFDVWLFSNPAKTPPFGYPKSLDGLISCYYWGLPFLKNTILGTLFFGLLFKLSFEGASNLILSKTNN